MYAENNTLIKILEQNRIHTFKKLVFTDDLEEQIELEEELKNIECRIERLNNGGI